MSSIIDVNYVNELHSEISGILEVSENIFDFSKLPDTRVLLIAERLASFDHRCPASCPCLPLLVRLCEMYKNEYTKRPKPPVKKRYIPDDELQVLVKLKLEGYPTRRLHTQYLNQDGTPKYRKELIQKTIKRWLLENAETES